MKEFLLGGHGSSDFEATIEHDGNTISSGHAVGLASNGHVSVANGELIGISMGADLSQTKKTIICRSGSDIPILLKPTITGEEGSEVEDFDFVIIGAIVKVDRATGKASSDGVATNAIYTSEVMAGVRHGSSVTHEIALVDMGGGL